MLLPEQQVVLHIYECYGHSLTAASWPNLTSVVDLTALGECSLNATECSLNATECSLNANLLWAEFIISQLSC